MRQYNMIRYDTHAMHQNLSAKMNNFKLKGQSI